MEINLRSILARKDLRSLECHWSSLCNKKNYFIPKSIDDLKGIGSDEINIQNTAHYFSKPIRDKIRTFVSKIYDNPLISDVLCYDSIYQSVIREMAASLNSKNKVKFECVINSISADINTKIDNHLFYFPLIDLILVGIKRISIGDVNIEEFDKTNLTEILDQSVIIHKNERFTEAVKCCISEHFIGKSIIIIPSYGDRTNAEKIAREKANFVVNYFRFITCLLFHERIDENLMKISIESAWSKENDPFFYTSQNKTELSLANDRGRRPLESFRITNERLSEIKNKGFFDDLGFFILKKEKTELESCILTAIYWIGEAQNENHRETSFLKYWTVLESIFTCSHERKSNSEQAPKVTHTLCKSVSIILAYSDYDFFEEKDINITYKKLEKLYDARSNVVHNGSYGKISAQELNDICKLSSWTVLTLFGLRKYYGISSISEIRPDINKLYDKTKYKRHKSISN